MGTRLPQGLHSGCSLCLGHPSGRYLHSQLPPSKSLFRPHLVNGTYADHPILNTTAPQLPLTLLSIFPPFSVCPQSLSLLNLPHNTLICLVHRAPQTVLGGAWVARSVGHPTSAQVMISRSVSSSPMSGSVLTAQSLEPASDSVSPRLPHSCSVSLCLSKINVKKIFFKGSAPCGQTRERKYI